MLQFIALNSHSLDQIFFFPFVAQTAFATRLLDALVDCVVLPLCKTASAHFLLG